MDVETPWDERLRSVVRSEETRGAYSLGEIATEPSWRRPTYVHHDVDEFFYVMAGDVAIEVQGREGPVVAGTGCAVRVPRGVARSVRRLGAGPGKLLLIQAPGGLLEQPASAVTASRAGIELVEPPG